MKNILILFLVVSVAQCRPGGGYEYSNIQGGHNEHIGHNIHSNGLHGGHAVASVITGDSGDESGYESGYSTNGGYNHEYISVAGGSGGVSTTGGNLIDASASLGSISGGYQSVHRHIYVHVPPSGFDEQYQPRIQGHFAKPQKHYKIIFIKTPSAPTYHQPIIPSIPQNEEKTLIYVLSKKAEQPADIVLPSPPVTPPSKPEVYFIKYQTRKESVANGAGNFAGAGINEGAAAAGINGGTGIGIETDAGGAGISSDDHNVEHVDNHGETHIESNASGGGGIGAAGLDIRHGGVEDVGKNSRQPLHVVVPAVIKPAAKYGPPEKSGPY